MFFVVCCFPASSLSSRPQVRSQSFSAVFRYNPPFWESTEKFAFMVTVPFTAAAATVWGHCEHHGRRSLKVTSATNPEVQRSGSQTHPYRQTERKTEHEERRKIVEYGGPFGKAKGPPCMLHLKRKEECSNVFHFLTKTICVQWFVMVQVEQHFRANIVILFHSRKILFILEVPWHIYFQVFKPTLNRHNVTFSLQPSLLFKMWFSLIFLHRPPIVLERERMPGFIVSWVGGWVLSARNSNNTTDAELLYVWTKVMAWVLKFGAQWGFQQNVKTAPQKLEQRIPDKITS